MRVSKALYIGETRGVHDLRFLDAIKEKYEVDACFTSDLINFASIDFESYDLIVAAPLTGTISIIPKNLTIPIVGISLAYDVNSENLSSDLRVNLQRCKLIVCDCKYIEDKIIIEHSFDQEKISVIPFGCDLDLFQSESQQKYTEPNILVTRNWFPTHSNKIVVEALQLLHEQGLDFNCTFVGNGPELQETIEKVSNSPMNSKIFFVGPKSPKDIRKLMNESNFYVSASRSDGSSVSLMEALAAGLICIVSDFPSNREWVDHQKSGFLFQNGSAESLCNMIREVLEIKPEVLSSISQVGIEVAKSKANWTKNRVDFLRVLESAIE